MKGQVYIDDTKIGEIDFIISDESMGGIEGKLKPNENYNHYKSFIQECCEKRGIANVTDLNLRILLPGGIELKPEGGIGITDIKKFDEVIVEAAGLDLSVLYE